MKPRLRILFVVGNLVAGGAERHLVELWRRLDRSRFDVAIACFRREGAFLAEAEALGWPIHELGVGRRIYGPSGLAGLARLLRLVRALRPDVVHGYLFGPNLFAAIAGRLAGVPVVAVAKRNVDAFESGRQAGAQRWAHRLATHVTAVSEAVAESVVALGVPRARITVIPNGVDAARFDPALRPASAARAALGGEPGPWIGSVGCLAPRKDQGVLLEAVARLAGRGLPVRVALVGDGPARGALEARARALGLEARVRFLGERGDVERLLPGMDVFALSSREEGIPNALLEAMAAARPCVATAVGGTPEVLRDGATGWLVPPGDPDALARALGEALADPAEARRRAEAARRAVLETMTLEEMARRHERFYERALAEARASGRGRGRTEEAGKEEEESRKEGGKDLTGKEERSTAPNAENTAIRAGSPAIGAESGRHSPESGVPGPSRATSTPGGAQGWAEPEKAWKSERAPGRGERALARGGPGTPSSVMTFAAETSSPAAETSSPAAETSSPAAETSAPASETSAPAAETAALASDTAAPASETAAHGHAPRSIAIVTTTFPTLASFVEDDVHRLRARGVRVGVFALRPTPREYQARHAPLLAVTETVGAPLDPRAWGALLGWLARRPGTLLGGAARILWASRRSPYALAGHLAWLPAACLVASRVERDGYERVHGAWAHFPGSVAWLAARLTRRPFSLSAHAGADLYRTRAFLAEKVRGARFTSACVEGNAALLRGLAGPDARVEWIPHGVDLARFDGAGRAPDPVPVLIAVGRLSAAKGFDDAIRALALVRGRGTRAALWIVGDGEDRAALESLARDRAVADAVCFHGALGHEDLLPLYRRAWLLVAPSRVLANGRRDGIPNVIVEGMAMGLPCVGTRVGGIEEAIVPGETGALAEPGDVEGLAAAIESVLRDPAARDRMGRAARARAHDRFDAARSFERTWALFAGAPEPPAPAPVPAPAPRAEVAR